MRSIRIRYAATAIAIAALAAAAAVAAPTADKTVPLSAAMPEFNWDGTQGQFAGPFQGYDSADCAKDPTYYCEIYLLDVTSTTPVTMDASLTQFSNDFADFDLRVHKSDEAGTGPGEQVESPTWDVMDPSTPGWGGPNGVEEFFHAENLAAGKYWLIVHHYFNPNATYKGNVKITGATGGAAPAPTPTPGGGGGGGTPPPSGGGGGGGGTPPPSGGSTPKPPPASGAASLPFKVPGTLGSAKKAKRKKALSFKATATQDITNLTITLLNAKKKAVGKAKIASFPKGSRKIKLKVKKLKAGKYQLAAEGTVNGQKQAIVQKVKVKK